MVDSSVLHHKTGGYSSELMRCFFSKEEQVFDNHENL